MEKIKLDEMLANHKKWLRCEAGGVRADLRGANLSDADLSGADLDFSCLPLWCGSLYAKFDEKHYVQFLYHILKSLESNDLIATDFKALLLTQSNIDVANTFHRVEECGKINY